MFFSSATSENKKSGSEKLDSGASEEEEWAPVWYHYTFVVVSDFLILKPKCHRVLDCLATNFEISVYSQRFSNFETIKA